MFTLKIKTANDSFRSESGKKLDPFSLNIRSILLKVERTLADPDNARSGPVLDYNGNVVGAWELTDEEGDEESIAHD